MAKKKKEDAPAPGSPAWMATFSDLMNLLLCFFVLLFSMSSVDAAKFNELAQSFAKSFSIFKAGGAFFGDGNLVGNGASQLNNLDEHINNTGKMADSETEQKDPYEEKGPDTSMEEQVEYYKQLVEQLTEKVDDLENAQAVIDEQKEAAVGAIYDEVSELAKRYNLGDFVEFGVDSACNYVKIDVKGSVLFDSGSAQIKSDGEAKSVLLKIGDILKEYDGFGIEIIGHTDNVPIKNSKYPDNDYLSAARAIETAQYLIEVKNLDPSKVSFSGRGEREPVDTNSTPEGRAKNRRIEFRIYSPEL